MSSALCMVGVPVDMSGTVLIGFSIPRRAIDADIKYPTSTEGWKRRLDGGGFGDNLRRALGLNVKIFPPGWCGGILQDVG